MKYASLLTVLLLFLSSPVAQESQSSVTDGNTLLPMCKEAVETADSPTWRSTHEAFNHGYCLGLVEGVSFSSPQVCPGKGVKFMQEVRVVVKYLEDNPQTLNLNEALLTERALSKAFPCPK